MFIQWSSKMFSNFRSRWTISFLSATTIASVNSHSFLFLTINLINDRSHQLVNTDPPPYQPDRHLLVIWSRLVKHRGAPKSKPLAPNRQYQHRHCQQIRVNERRWTSHQLQQPRLLPALSSLLLSHLIPHSAFSIQLRFVLRFLLDFKITWLINDVYKIVLFYLASTTFIKIIDSTFSKWTHYVTNVIVPLPHSQRCLCVEENLLQKFRYSQRLSCIYILFLIFF